MSTGQRRVCINAKCTLNFKMKCKSRIKVDDCPDRKIRVRYKSGASKHPRLYGVSMNMGHEFSGFVFDKTPYKVKLKGNRMTKYGYRMCGKVFACRGVQ